MLDPRTVERLKIEMAKLKEELDTFKFEKQVADTKYIEQKNKYIEALSESCKSNIGRCFKKEHDGKVICYKVINIDKLTRTLTNELDFNEYQYPVLCFEYPYDNSLSPFSIKSLYINENKIGNFLKNVKYEEINNFEFNDKFNAVNSSWTNKIMMI